MHICLSTISTISTISPHLEPLLLQLGLLRAGRGPLRVRGVRGLQDRRGQGAGLGGALAQGQEVGGYLDIISTRVLLIVCRCGAEYPLPDNSGPTQCDPNSENFCCSKWGYCGGDGEHCGCPECVNYRDNK